MTYAYARSASYGSHLALMSSYISASKVNLSTPPSVNVASNPRPPVPASTHALIHAPLVHPPSESLKSVSVPPTSSAEQNPPAQQTLTPTTSVVQATNSLQSANTTVVPSASTKSPPSFNAAASNNTSEEPVKSANTEASVVPKLSQEPPFSIPTASNKHPVESATSEKQPVSSAEPSPLEEPTPSANGAPLSNPIPLKSTSPISNIIIVKPLRGKNIDKDGNVEAKIEHNTGHGGIKQTNNNVSGSNSYKNLVKGNGLVSVHATGGNVVAGVNNAQGNTNVVQSTNGDGNTNTVLNNVTSQINKSKVVFAAGNTVGKASEVTGSNSIGQSSNNNDAKNAFTNE